MTSATRREVIEYLATFDPKTRAALESDDIAVFCYWGWGVVLNSAQEESMRDVIEWPAGSIHLWRWANRTGKTTGDILFHYYSAWKKWRYWTDDTEVYDAFRYRTLHAAPLNRLMGKAWEAGDSMIRGTAWQQRNPITSLQRKANLAPFFTARTGKTPDGSDSMWIDCVNNSIIDFLSTHDGAGRMESETWWVISWDEFVRHQPVDAIPLLFDQTFLPRTSDFMAPLIMSGTVTESSDPIYAELEEYAAESPKDWNIASYGRQANFSQTKESIDRQRRLSINKEVADRSVDGKLGEGGRGSLFPTHLLRNAFDADLPEHLTPEQIASMHGQGYEFFSAFDHAASGDLNVIQTWAVPWPWAQVAEWPVGSIRGASLVERRSGHHLTPALQAQFAASEVDKFESKALIVDGTGEGGVLVYRQLRGDLAGMTSVIPCNFSARAQMKGTSTKEMGLQSTQKFLGWGLDVAADENGWTEEWPDPGEDGFGLVRLPTQGAWRKLRRELAVLKRDDQHQRQDRAMTTVMLAWYLRRYIETRQMEPQPFSIIPSRKRPQSRRSVSIQP